MTKKNVVVFQPYPFEVGQKIRIDEGPRKGDWKVIDVSERKVKLRCPLSGTEVEWAHFCYFAGQRDDLQWPQED